MKSSACREWTTCPSVPRALACLLPCLISSIAGPGEAAWWTHVNPGGGGPLTCVAGGPTGVIVVGSDIAGAFRSTDFGATWANIGYLNGGLEKAYVGAVAFDPADAKIVYLGGDGGLYRSADAGRTFARRVSGGFWTAIAVAPSDPQVVYAARHGAYSGVDPQIHRSLDRGLSWQLVGVLPVGTRVLKLAVRPNGSSQLLAVSGFEKALLSAGQPRRALYVSDDGGATWTDAHGDSTIGGMTGNPWDAAYDPDHPDTIFATTVVGASNPDTSEAWSGYTWRGSQAGGTWSQISTHTGAILARRSAPGVVQILTVDVRRDGPGCAECGPFQSIDGGGSWSRASDMTGWDTGWIGSTAWAYSASITGVSRTLGQSLLDPADIYWVTSQFIWGSSNAGASFANLFTNQPAPGYWRGRGIDNIAPAALSVSGGMLYAGLYDLGIWRSTDLGASWQSANDPALTGSWAGRGGNCMTILADPARANIVWASQGGQMGSARLIRSESGGAPGSWTLANGIPQGFLSGLSMDPGSPGNSRTLFVTSNGDVYKSTDDGVSWSLVFDCDSCYVSATAGTLVFAGGQKGLWRSLDGGSNWTESNPGEFHLGPSGFALTAAKWRGPHDVLISGDTVYVAVYGNDRGIYRSADAGGAWTKVLTDDYARTVQRDGFGSLYVGSSSASESGGIGPAGATGIQVSADAGATWSNMTFGLPWPFVWPIATRPLDASSSLVIVGSPGSGFWSGAFAGGRILGVDSPQSGGLRLFGFRPNPAGARISVAFSLPSSDPATLAVFDLAGRRLARREVGPMGPGDHVLSLESQFSLAPGIYVIRLVQGGRSASVTSAVVR